jgi:ADP-heptose:LPS heptosyltransferase
MSLLIIRTSAMGDVALTAPVLKGMRNQYPDTELIVVTRSLFAPFFSSIPGIKIISPDLKGRHKGLAGIFRLFNDIRGKEKIDKVVDLHDVLRSKVLRLLFSFTGVPVFVIDKGRKEKRDIIKGKSKVKLPHSVERYADVFKKAGFPVVLPAGPWIIPASSIKEKADSLIIKGKGLNIGVAPFAKHKLKMWPEDKMMSLLKMISEKYDSKFWFFGGADEKERLAVFQENIPGSVSLAGNRSLPEELALMCNLDLMIAMDSSNMHMAALVGTKVVSIWGATDPIIGFGAWMQPDDFFIKIPFEELSCRPCTVFGKGECRRKDLACLMFLTPEIVFSKIDKIISSEIANSRGKE